jgi:hypothetical protein
MRIPNLLLIAGTGTKSGKTTLACRIIEQFKHLNITAIKITPHFHETTPGLQVIIEEPGYAIYEETNIESQKDTSRMLRAGAARVYYAKVLDDRLLFVFNKIKELIPEGTPIVCESPALRYFAEPGAFLIISSETTDKRKEISELLKLPHVMFKFEELDKISSLHIGFATGEWRIASSQAPRNDRDV